MADKHLNNSPEIWKAIPGFPAYEISTHGNVRSFWKRGWNQHIGRGSKCIIANKPQKVLAPGVGRSGYLIVVLMEKSVRRTLYIHKLVLETFVGPCPPSMQA